MLTMSTKQALDLLHELELCYYGENGFGSDTAEVYAYQLLPHSPSAAGPPPQPGSIFYEEWVRRAHEAADNLGAVLKEFMSYRPDVAVEIDDHEPFDKDHPVAPFAHRVHVRITKMSKGKKRR